MGSSDFVNRRLGGSLVIAALALALTASGAFAALTVEVTPNHLRVAYGASADLVLVARDANGSVVTGTVAWEVVPARLGTITTSGSQAFTNGAAASVSQSAATILDRFIQIPPTITIREGHRVKVYFTQDLLLPAYSNHTIPQTF